MASNDRIGRALSVVLPRGALGASVVLALSSAQATPVAAPPTDAGDSASSGVAERLSAIRAGVSQLALLGPGTAEPQPDGSKLIPTWWGNGGWGRWHFGWGNHGFGWPNWHNWGNGWHNWGNGGNGWNNWNNGWHNYWHNY
jgi:rSAM-associated Gly-rich repeat protein